MTDSSRMTELAQEIIGAQAVARMFEELWSTMKPADKERLNAALVERALKEIQGHEVGSMLRALLAKSVTDLSERHLLTVRDGVVERFSPQVCEKMIDEVVSELQRKVKANLVSRCERAVETVKQERGW